MTTALDTLFVRDTPLRILVVGDVMIDGYLEGDVGRTSPEAPVPVVLSKNTRHVAGGAANVANNLRALGSHVTLAGFTGDDAEGKTLAHLVQAAGIEHCFVKDPSRPTTYKLRIVAQNQHMLRIDRESKNLATAAMTDALWNKIEPLLARVDGVVVSDYAKGVVGISLMNRLIAEATKLGLKVCVDPKGRDYSRYRGAYMITPNRREVGEAAQRNIDLPEDFQQAVAELKEQTQAEVVLATCGADGMLVYESDKQALRLPAQASEVYDVTGAGDTVISVAAMGVFCGMAVSDAAELANIAAGIAVGKFGTVVVLPEELRSSVARGGSDQYAKILDFDEAVSVAERYRQAGKNIVFTNGCFDLLHAGHVHYLQQARLSGDLLMIGLNTDASVQRLKGPKRPIVPEKERAAVLSALECVSHVVLFDEDTPKNIIESLKPDVLVKGADWPADKVVGRDFVEGRGGKLVLIDTLEGRSSTEIVNTILARESANTQAG
ncbi:MAG: D-glycero-beta-D-manno-heptose-7-phosphate kinase [Deltaproteobacteria bacterium]|jgi:D-beta-D-heptose 7-phosphate kinase / D-beta-D-heptose 1-phosphate adenosyltransferase|nr:D-glycero-beta-D-manno-heptose-7-phosphate kinase [Deltaproteobacteria bacterium]MBT6433525.1 D-glycero-beta-D-manno-heptose-7-phosphate kinase [Deltaproteobacteria bacterium]MBT6491719.1 D-glycero-beta-D-manno-heptose-7-phosphate kinase [Deltaproteobacteria bacterium]